MANTIVLFGEAGSNKIYKIGKVGYDSGATATFDPDSTVFTGEMKTERVSPAGEDGLVRFRRIVLRALKGGEWTVTFTIWVDDIQTQIYDNTQDSSPLINQTIVISNDADDLGEGEAVIEADIDATGTFVQVLVSMDSDDIKGYFLPESIEMHGQVMRQSRSRPAGPVTDMTSHTAESQ